MPLDRNERYHSTSSDKDPEDARGNTAQRDRDRLLYSNAFRRLDGVTQVVSPQEGLVFHNRLTHTLKVAQIGRRLAERLLSRPESSGLVAHVGGIDPDVVETAALAHDLGHPPFGHLAEELLSTLLEKSGVSGGYEGNAQSFRIVTTLAAHRLQYGGLNLTRASLNALLKYPWLRDTQQPQRSHKWGAYESERPVLEWVRGDLIDGAKCVEAALMDWADDVAYSVHDVEDFYRAGLMPLDRLRNRGDEQDSFLQAALARIRMRTLGAAAEFSEELLTEAFRRLIEIFPIPGLYKGTFRHRAALRAFSSQLIQGYINGVDLVDPDDHDGKSIVIDDNARKEVIMLKELTWYYVINNPSLATQRHGQRQVIRTLFSVYRDAARNEDRYIFPDGPREQILAGGNELEQARAIVDYIASMTEVQAVRLYQRFTGASLGSVLDPVGL